MRSEVELLQAWVDGERAAGDALFERHFDAIRRFFLNKVQSGVDDLIQRTFLGLLEARDRAHEVENLRAFLFGIARHVLIDHYRAARRDFDELQTSVFDINPSPSVIVAEHEQGQQLLEALRRIPLDLQVVLELHYWEGMGVREIAQVLEIAEGTTKSRLRRGRELLLERIDKRVRRKIEQEGPETLDAWAAGLRSAISGAGRNKK